MASVGIYLLKVNNKNNGTRCEICSQLTIKMPDTLHLVLVFLSLTLNMKLPAGDVKQLVHFVNNAKVVRRPSLDEVHIVVKFC